MWLLIHAEIKAIAKFVKGVPGGYLSRKMLHDCVQVLMSQNKVMS